MYLSKVELAFLGLNLFVLGALFVLMALRGPSVPAILLAVGTAGMALAKIGKQVVPQADDSESK
jgi:hypothetical protein